MGSHGDSVSDDTSTKNDDVLYCLFFTELNKGKSSGGSGSGLVSWHSENPNPLCIVVFLTIHGMQGGNDPKQTVYAIVAIFARMKEH